METNSEMTSRTTWYSPNISAESKILSTTQTSLYYLTNDNSTTKPGQIFIPCNNPENLINEPNADIALQVLYVGYVPLIGLFGITTNIINCVVFTRQGLKDRINLCLFSLAIADLSFLVLIFSAKCSSFLGLFDEELEEYWRARHSEIVLGPMLGAVEVSNMMTTIISVERCICVVSPFTAKKYLKTKYMATIIAIMVVYILGFYSLINVQYTTVHVTDPRMNTSRWVAGSSNFFLENIVIMNILYNYLLDLAISCLSLTVVIVATSITVIKLKQTQAWRHQSVTNKDSAGERKEAAVTKMLAVICSIYVVTITPSSTQAFARVLIPDYLPTGKYCNAFHVIQALAHSLEVTNSSVNFIVYFTMGSRFRDTVRQLFGTWREKNESSMQSLPTAS